MQDPSLYSQMKPLQQRQSQYPEQEQLKCPRCDSTNTKFCYYNNYNLSQPRHFCRSCRRYWTKGGALRNIPVGGGSRKNTRRSSSAATKRPNSKSDSKSNSGVTETLPEKGGNSVGQLGNMLEASGEQLANFLDGRVPNGTSLQMSDPFGDPGWGEDVNPQVWESSSISHTDGFLNILGGGTGSGGDNGCCGGRSSGWSDLAMYTPESTFQ